MQTEHGWFQAHAYRYEDGMSTFIVETPEETWQAAGIEQMSQEEGIAYCEKLFAPWLDGNPLVSNASHLRGSAIWIRFPRVICNTWVHWNTLDTARGERRVPVVLMGDAAHTAHFSIGSGTKLALEDSIELARCLSGAEGSVEHGLKHYEEVRSVEVLKIQNAARNSTEWFENVKRYAGLEPEQFAYSLLTRSQRISHENLRLRDPAWLEGFERWIAERAGAPALAGQRPAMPMLTPYQARGVRLKNRIMVSPMAMYSCQDGVPGDFHLVHLGEPRHGRRRPGDGGDDLRFARRAHHPGCPGLWNDEQARAFTRIVDFVHGNSDARIGVQIGHAGRKGSTQLGWQKIDHPLAEGNWPLLSASALPYIEGVSQTPRAMTRADMDQVRDNFVAATRRAVAAGFDWLELHCAHGYLLSSFISPLTNQRDDEYGGSLENRLRYPLEVFHAVRAAWPEDKPMSVRISAHDWVEGGITPDDAVEIARRFKAAGADMIDCSSGQVSKAEKPVYGRMFQTPFADRVRNEAGIPTIAVGAIFEADHANAIIASNCADLCALARPHLADASWTLREAARVGYRDVTWPSQYFAGKRQLETNFERAAAMAQLDVK
ncbi:bifunctional salicylyl-CoA 5-hydroxylase/oxidoreductase [Achromobacter xylosoxidans]